MQTFDQALMDLVKRKVISYEEALRQSSNPDDFKLKFSGIDSTSDTSWSDFERGKEQEEKDTLKIKTEEGLEPDGQVTIERF
jgi:twitching motility protein PilT